MVRVGSGLFIGIRDGHAPCAAPTASLHGTPHVVPCSSTTSTANWTYPDTSHDAFRIPIGPLLSFSLFLFLQHTAHLVFFATASLVFFQFFESPIELSLVLKPKRTSFCLISIYSLAQAPLADLVLFWRLASVCFFDKDRT